MKKAIAMCLKCQKHLKMNKFSRNIIILSIGLSFIFSEEWIKDINNNYKEAVVRIVNYRNNERT